MENDKEWGNQLIQDYGFRLYNPAIGKFLSFDPLAPDYPELTPYQFASNTPIMAIDLDGLEAKINITTEIIGYTAQFIYGQSGRMDKGALIVVPVYKAIIADAQNPKKELGAFGVTRDGWYSRGKGVDGHELFNRTFEPADGNVNLYTTPGTKYEDTGEDAFYFTQYGDKEISAEPFKEEWNKYLDGSDINEPRKKLDKAKGVMIHIGGHYYNSHPSVEGNKVAGSYGCFGFICQKQIYSKKEDAEKIITDGNVGMNGTSNKEWRQTIQKIISVKNKTKGEKKY